MPVELPVIYENPRFDTATPTLKPVIDRAIRFGAIMMAEWGSLTLIEEAPRYLKIATVAIAILILAVHESWPWLRMRNKRLYPIFMIALIVAYTGIFVYAFVMAPQHSPTPQLPQSQSLLPTNDVLLDQMRIERDELKRQNETLQRVVSSQPKSKWLHLDDAQRWRVVKSMTDGLPSNARGCTIAQAFNSDGSPEFRKVQEVWGEIQQPLFYSGWRFTQINKSFIPPGFSVFVGGDKGTPAFECGARLKELFDSLNIQPSSFHANQSSSNLIACNNECVKVILGNLEMP